MQQKIRVIYADDDIDDRFFFEMALAELSVDIELKMIEDGEKLLQYLSENATALPDVLFLDLNMPRKNGAECLEEIKAHEQLRSVPVVICSTSLHDTIADQLFELGAHFYIKKSGYEELEENLRFVLSLIQENKFERPARDKFVLSTQKEY